MASGKSLELANIGPSAPQPGCVKKGCRMSWPEHLVLKGARKGQIKVALEKEGGHALASGVSSAAIRRMLESMMGAKR